MTMAKSSGKLKLIRDIGWLFGTASLIVLAGCGAGTDSPESMDGCIEVSRARLDGIQAGLIVAGGSLSEGWAYPSGVHEDAYFIAAEIDGPDLEGAGDEHLYFTTSLEVRGLTLSVNEITDEFSDWPHGAIMDPQTSIDDPGVREAQECLRQAQSNR